MKKLFDDYVKNYDFRNPKNKLKYNHSLRVANIAEIIAKEMNLSKEDIYLAKACGLLHDIGRFEQIKLHNTFDDLVSIDHGDLGYKVFLRLFKDKLDFTEEEKDIMAKAILYHNKLTIPNLDKRTKLFCDITRDADKIDILYICCIEKRIVNITKEPLSEKCVEYFQKHEQIPHKYMKTESDKNLDVISFIWDINFDSSLKIINDNKYLSKMKKIINNPNMDEYFDEADKYIKERV